MQCRIKIKSSLHTETVISEHKLNLSTGLLVIQLVPFCWSQTFEGCDFNQDVTVGSFYEVSSPNYESNQNYPPGRLCRWTGR